MTHNKKQLLKTLSEKLSIEELEELANTISSDKDEAYAFVDELDTIIENKTVKVERDAVKFDLFDPDNAIGLTLEQVKEKFPWFKTRVVSNDGVGAIVTADYRVDRLSISLVNGVVDSCHIG